MIFRVTLLLAMTLHVDITCNEYDLNTASSCDFPESFEVQLQSAQPFRVTFTLKRNDWIDIDAPVYINNHASRDVAFISPPVVQVKRTAAYQSLEFGAYFLVRCKENRYELEGTIYLDGRKFRLAPSRDGGATVHTVTKVSWYDVTEVKDMPQTDISIKRPVVGGSPQWLEQEVDTERVLRRKRASTKTDYYLDIIVALDYSFYKYWLNRANNVDATAVTNMKEYIAYIFNGINGRYKSITILPFTINILLRGYIIAKSSSESPWTEEIKETSSDRVQVNALTMLARLQDYVNKTNPPCDHVVGFTDYDLYSDDSGFRFNNTAGFANVGAMCYPNGASVSVVEDHGGYQSETTATHELGHSLGALHDGNNNNCSSADRYIMSTGSQLENDGNKYNPWHFSNCSIQYFYNFINKLIADKLENTCLQQKMGQQDVPTVTGLPGYLHGPDEQCRQIYGNTSYLCRGTTLTANSEDICVSMYCHLPSTNLSCALTTAAQGTCCNTGKWCIDGQCVKSSNATSCYMSASCPFGQRQGVVFNGRTCNELESGYCYQSVVRGMCCEMCDKQWRNITGCEYGDKAIGCRSDSCYTSNQNECCGTCSYQSSPSTLHTTPPPTSNPTTTTTTTKANSAANPTTTTTTTKANSAANSTTTTTTTKANSAANSTTTTTTTKANSAANSTTTTTTTKANTAANSTTTTTTTKANTAANPTTTTTTTKTSSAATPTTTTGIKTTTRGSSTNPTVITPVALPMVTCRVIPGLEPICAAGCIMQSLFMAAVFTAAAKLLSTFASL